MNYYGSICLSDIPKEVIKTGKNGKKYLNISIWEREKPSEWGQTHTISCAPKKEERQEGVNYLIGDLKPIEARKAEPAKGSTPDTKNDDDLPF